MRPNIQTQYVNSKTSQSRYGNNMEEIVLFWPWGKLKSITYLKDGEPVDRVLYDEDGNYKDFESMRSV